MKTFAYFLSAVLACAAAVPASSATKGVTIGRNENTAVLDTATADSCRPTIVERFTRRAIHRIAPFEAGQYALISQDFQVGQGCFEGFSPAKATISARTINVRTGAVAEKALWSFSTEAVSGQIEGDHSAELYRADMPGCCGANATAKYFSLDTGALIGSSTGGLLDVTFEDHREAGRQTFRLITAEDSLAASPQGPKGTVATVFLSDGQSVLEMISLTGAGKYGREGWGIAEFGFKGAEAGRSVLVTPLKGEHKLYLRLVCQCDAAPVEILLPYSVDGVDEKAATVQGALEVKFAKYRHPRLPLPGAK